MITSLDWLHQGQYGSSCDICRAKISLYVNKDTFVSQKGGCRSNNFEMLLQHSHVPNKRL